MSPRGRLTYTQAREDHEYLWSTYGPANDMTGGYVDQEDLHRLLRNPTKTMARTMYRNQIRYWFDMGPERSGLQANRDALKKALRDSRVREIAWRYGFDRESLRSMLELAECEHDWDGGIVP